MLLTHQPLPQLRRERFRIPIIQVVLQHRVLTTRITIAKDKRRPGRGEQQIDLFQRLSRRFRIEQEADDGATEVNRAEDVVDLPRRLVETRRDVQAEPEVGEVVSRGG